MYRPNFCSECGAKILRLHWHTWTSRKFCDDCSKRLLKQRLTVPLVLGFVLLSIGVVAGRAGRPAPPPLIIERGANSPLYKEQSVDAIKESVQIPTTDESANSPSPQGAPEEELVYICVRAQKRGHPALVGFIVLFVAFSTKDRRLSCRQKS